MTLGRCQRERKTTTQPMKAKKDKVTNLDIDESALRKVDFEDRNHRKDEKG